jgi:hypothetical protein
MTLNDDRTEEQKVSHPWIVLATDSFMSGWSCFDRYTSYAGWAHRPEDRDQVLAWVHSRPEMKRVREVGSDYRPSGPVHCHIYVVGTEHSALKGVIA